MDKLKLSRLKKFAIFNHRLSCREVGTTEYAGCFYTYTENTFIRWGSFSFTDSLFDKIDAPHHVQSHFYKTAFHTFPILELKQHYLHLHTQKYTQ